MTFEIIVPGRFIEPKDPVQLEARLEGWFDLAAVRNGKVVRTRTFKDPMVQPFRNLILNQGLNRFGTETSIYNYLSLGLGTTPPSVTDTDLAAGIYRSNAGLSATHGGRVAPNWESHLTLTWLTAIGALGNNNLTEIGVGGQSAGQLFSRALIADAEGNPVSFPISDEEQLQASYRLYLYPPLEDGEFTVDVSGSRDVITRACAVNSPPSTTGTSGWGLPYSFSGWATSIGNVNGATTSQPVLATGDIVGITDGYPDGRAGGTGSVSVSPYVNNSYKRKARQSWSSAQANGTWRSHIIAFGNCVFQVQYDPPLVKTSDQTMFLEYEFGWARK